MMRQDRFTQQAQEVLAASQEMVRQQRHSQWDVEHVLLALLQHPGGLAQQIFEKLGVDVERLRERVADTLGQRAEARATTSCRSTRRRASSRMLETANAEAERLKDEYVGVEHLLIAIADERDGESARILREFNIDKERIYRALQEVRGGARVDSPTAESQLRRAREVQHRPDGDGAPGQARPRDRPRRRDQARHADPQPAHQEQPGDHRRGRRRQDGHRRGAGAEDRRRRRAGEPEGQARAGPRHGRDGRRHRSSAASSRSA